jgi:hypothetical protein
MNVGKPMARPEERPSAKKCPALRIAPVAAPETSPAPILGPANEICAKGVSLHVAGDCEKVFIALDRKRLKATLIKGSRPACSVKGMPALGMGDREPAQRFGEIPVGPWPHQ